MVSDHRVGPCGTRQNDVGRDRGQLILIGAIALAFIILGLVVVVNGVLFTETLAPGASGQSGSEAATVEDELERGIAGIVHRGNLDDDLDLDDLDGVINESYADRYRNTTANSRPAIVDVEFDEKVQNASVKTGSVSSIGSPLPTTNVGHLAFELEANGNGNISIKDEKQDKEITITENGSTFLLKDGNNNCSVDDKNARVNIVSGKINVSTSSDCEFNTIDPSSPSSLNITGNNMEGAYELVVKDNVGSGYDTGRAWAIDVTVTYESNDVSYKRTQRVFVYGDRS